MIRFNGSYAHCNENIFKDCVQLSIRHKSIMTYPSSLCSECMKQFIDVRHYGFLLTIYSTLGIVPLIMSTLMDTKLSKKTPKNYLKNNLY